MTPAKTDGAWVPTVPKFWAPGLSPLSPYGLDSTTLLPVRQNKRKRWTSKNLLFRTWGEGDTDPASAFTFTYLKLLFHTWWQKDNLSCITYVLCIAEEKCRKRVSRHRYCNLGKVSRDERTYVPWFFIYWGKAFDSTNVEVLRYKMRKNGPVRTNVVHNNRMR